MTAHLQVGQTLNDTAGQLIHGILARIQVLDACQLILHGSWDFDLLEKDRENVLVRF